MKGIETITDFESVIESLVKKGCAERHFQESEGDYAAIKKNHSSTISSFSVYHRSFVHKDFLIETAHVLRGSVAPHPNHIDPSIRWS